MPIDPTAAWYRWIECVTWVDCTHLTWSVKVKELRELRARFRSPRKWLHRILKEKQPRRWHLLFYECPATLLRSTRLIGGHRGSWWECKSNALPFGIFSEWCKWCSEDDEQRSILFDCSLKETTAQELESGVDRGTPAEPRQIKQ